MLALLGGVGTKDELWVWAVAGVCAAAVVVFESVAWRQESSAESILGRKYEIVLSRVLSLISDLADLTAREFDLWVVDLYLPRSPLLLLLPFVGRRVCDLHLVMHVSLTDVRAVPSKVGPNECVGECYSGGQTKLWWDIGLVPSGDENCWRSLNEDENKGMAQNYGIASVNPVVDILGKECRGVLVVHGMRDEEVVRKVLGALQQREGRRRIAAACRDLHGHLGKW